MSASIAATDLPARASRIVADMPGLMGNAMRAGIQPVSPASAAAFRIIFGLIGVAAVVRFAAKGWISELYIEPAHHFSYHGFEWVHAWPGWGMYLHFALLGLAGLGVALGYRYRLCIIAFFLLFTYVEVIDKTTYLNHYYLVSLLAVLMVFLPLNRAWALDAWRGRAGRPQPTVPRGALWLLRAQVGLVYVFAGIAKLNADWMLNAQPLTIWLYNSADTPIIGVFMREAWPPYVMSWAGAGFDLTIVGWLLWKRTRPFAYAILVIFHVATAVLFPAIGMFPWIMMTAALIFFEPDWPLRLLGRLRRGMGQLPDFPTSSTAYPAPTNGLTWMVKAFFVLAVLFLAVQVLVPMRHLAYPGNVHWTEEGYRFSWRVLVTEKTGLARFRVSSLDLGQTWLVHPSEYLTPLQAERMGYQPDMILATAYIIRDDFVRRGHEEVEVRADAYVAYNGRPSARLIDPEVDLAKVDASIAPKFWVLNPARMR